MTEAPFRRLPTLAVGVDVCRRHGLDVNAGNPFASVGFHIVLVDGHKAEMLREAVCRGVHTVVGKVQAVINGGGTSAQGEADGGREDQVERIFAVAVKDELVWEMLQ